MEFVITLPRLFLYMLVLVNCLQTAVCFPHSLDKSDTVTEELEVTRTLESELTTKTTVTESVSVKLLGTDLEKTQNKSNKEKVHVEIKDNIKRVVSSKKPIDLLDLMMGTEPKPRHAHSSRAAARRRARTATKPKLKQIYSKWKLFLSIDKNGRVYGTNSKNVTFKNDDTTIFEISHGPSMHSLLLLKGRASSLYLCINSTGHMYGSRIPFGECYFQENLHRNDGWTSFSSCEYPSKLKSSLCRGGKRKGWMVALNKDGSPRNAQTAYNTKKRSTRFLKTDVRIKKSTSR